MVRGMVKHADVSEAVLPSSRHRVTSHSTRIIMNTDVISRVQVVVKE
jgi:hypothetical protein